MLVSRKMPAVVQGTGSRSTAQKSLPHRRRRPPEAEDESSLLLSSPVHPSERRSLAIFFSRLVRYVAFSGESGIILHATVATTTAGKPSTRKSSLHGAMGPPSANLVISHARDEANVVASGAASSVRFNGQHFARALPTNQPTLSLPRPAKREFTPYRR